MVNDVSVETADRAARIWAAAEPGPIVPGSEAHKTAFCRMLLDTHNRYKPAIIDWPVLDHETRERLVNLPIWDIAVQTEGKARLRVLSYGETVTDPLLRQAIELDGREEGRHKEVLANLVEAYGIRLAPEPDYVRPRDPEWAFMVTGLSECIDSFFAFGLFALAKRSGFFPRALVETFEPVMQEEGRHILFFVNWLVWHRRRLAWWRRPLFVAKTLAVWAFLIWERIGFAWQIGGTGAKDAAGPGAPGATQQDNNFTVTGSKSLASGDLSAAELIEICLSENDRRLSGYDPRLLRPKAVPRTMRLARRLMRWRGPVAAAL
ncbi:MAG TPA: ferritin-like domain-containing protein [Stellaceae bacterium]|nr:ferritin-like domain-containing protein [Stellaceae bacterium]